jgi:hypothetical protein
MAHDYSDIQDDFYEGIDEIFTEMFSDRVFIHLMDADSGEDDLYGEVPADSFKKYLEPIALVGSVTETVEKDDSPHGTETVGVTIRVPARQLAENAIPHLAAGDMGALKKAKFSFHSMERILIDTIAPKVMVADMFHLYEFRCHAPKAQREVAV